jgi:hypothetical protein
MDVPTIVVEPGEGRSLWLGGTGVVFKVSRADTERTFAVVGHPMAHSTPLYLSGVLTGERKGSSTMCYLRPLRRRVINEECVLDKRIVRSLNVPSWRIPLKKSPVD